MEAAAAPSPVPAPGLRPHVVPLALFAVVAVLLTWPAPLHLASAIPGAATSDAYDHYWGYAWYATKLGHGEVPLRTDTSHWPSGGLLWFVDPIGAILSLPVQLLAGPAAGYTFALIVQLWGGMAAAYALGWSEVRQRAPAALAGVIFGASPYALSILYSGTVEFLNLAPLPLFWMALQRALAEPPALKPSRSALAAAACWAWATLGNFYYAAFCGLLLGIAVVIDLVKGRPMGEGGRRGEGPPSPRVLRATVPILVAYALFAAPILGVAGWTLTSADAVVSRETAPGWSYGSLPATDVWTFLHPGQYYFPDNRAMGNSGIIHVNYLGWVALLAALVGAWKERRLRAPLLMAAVLALGPTLAWHQAPVRIGPNSIPLPATLLYLPGSPFKLVHHPYRLVVLPMLLMAVAAARAVVDRPRLAAALGVAVLAETLLVSPAVWPLPTADVTAPEWYHKVHDDASVRGIWDFPPNYHVANRWYQALAVVHGKKMPYGVNLFLPKAFRDNHLARTLMQCLHRPSAATIAREGGRPLQEFLQRPSAAKVEDGRAQLIEWGYDVIAVHTDQLQESESACVGKALGGEPEQDGKLLVYPLAKR